MGRRRGGKGSITLASCPGARAGAEDGGGQTRRNSKPFLSLFIQLYLQGVRRNGFALGDLLRQGWWW